MASAVGRGKGLGHAFEFVREATMAGKKVAYFVFDVEIIADAALVAKLRYPEESLEPNAAVRRYRDELLEQSGSDFIPYTYQIPVSVTIAKVGEDYRLQDLVTLDEPHFRPHVLAEKFWRGWEVYKQPTFVTFNGRTFDIPLMELAAFRFGISIARWFGLQEKSYAQPRNRYNLESHFDLCDVLTNFGAARFSGGLNLAANLLGKPGKIDVKGHMVQDLYEAGKLSEINDYCRCDVLDTYFVFLRTCVMLGRLALDAEQQIVAETKDWLAAKAQDVPAYATYLQHWGDWKNPWQAHSEKPGVL